MEFMAHLWEPLRWMHKPLIVYIFAECIWLSTDCLLRVLGFRAYKHQNVRAPQVPYLPHDPSHLCELPRQAVCSGALEESNGSDRHCLGLLYSPQ